MNTRKIALHLTIILALILTAMLQGIALVRANPTIIPPMPETPDLNEPSITIQLPEQNKTYNVNTVPYLITVEKPSSWFDFNPVHGMIMTIDYILDGNQRVRIADEPAYYEREPFTYEGKLSGLSEGNHTIEVYLRSDSFYDPEPRPTSWPLSKMPPQDYYVDTYSGKINFTIDITPPLVSFLVSYQNVTYPLGEVPLDFVVSEPASKLTYRLDDQENMTIAGNCTLTDLSNGVHSLTLYAWDLVGNSGASETITFTVNNPESPAEPEPTPTLPAITTVACAAVVVVGLVYLKTSSKKDRNLKGGLNTNLLQMLLFIENVSVCKLWQYRVCWGFTSF